MKRLNLILILGINLIYLISCGTNQRAATEILDLETAKVISHLPADVIQPYAEIKIRFVDPQIKEDQLANSRLNPGVLETEPEIDGKLSWADERTIVLKPDKPLKAHEQYTLTLNLDKFDNKKLHSLKPVVFKIRVAGQELAGFDGDFYLAETGNPQKVYYQAILKFVLDIDIQKLKEAISFKTENGRKIDFTLKPAANSKEIILKSQDLVRDKKEHNYIITLDEERLELPASFSRTVTLTALSDLRVTGIEKDESGDQPRIQIDFSDELDVGQDINGFIHVEPPMAFTLRKMGKTVFVNAPFEYGESYTFDIKEGLRSKWATTMTKPFSEKISFEDLLPEIKFSRDGVFLPTANQQKIAFMTVNVTKVHLKIMRVFESNLGQFLQMENLNASADRADRFDYEINRVGVNIVDTTLVIGSTKNRWLQNELDLKNILNPKIKGLLLLELYFEKQDMIYNEEANSNYANYHRKRRNDYGKPGSYWYMYNKAHVYKPVLLSDIGLTFKKADAKAFVYTTNLLTSEPLANVKIRLRSYQNQVISEGQTDANGMAEFPDKETVFYVEAQKDAQRSLIKVNYMQWNTSNFDVNGREINPGGLNAFIYTERGVYRPGDTVNVSIIVRNKSGTFPENHPVSLKVDNPRGQTVFTQTQNNARDGFYSFRFHTSSEDLTGNYNARFTAGSAVFSHAIKIETVVPERLKIKLTADKDELSYDNRELNLTIQANYLFGNPAANLDCETNVSIRKAQTHFADYPGFIFESANRYFRDIDEQVLKQPLDSDGKLNIKWSVPDLSLSPGRVRARFDVKVLEKGGRPAKSSLIIPIEPFKNYVGIKLPDLQWGYARVGTAYNIPVILVNTSGQSVPGKTLKYIIYKNESYWWWEYNNRTDFRLHFKEDSHTEKLGEGQIISGTAPTSFSFKPDKRGEYLIEVSDESKGGHSTAVFLNAYYWGESPGGQKNAGTLVLNSDKKEYKPGDHAVVSFPVPQEGHILMTLEKGNDILSSMWYPVPGGDKKEMELTIPVTEKMLPTAYVSVSLIQPHAVTKNDRPLRTFGIIPLNVYDPASRHTIKINMADELQTGKPFSVDVQTVNRQQAQFTIAVVDEGLLQLTNFLTPDPWDYFYSKERLGVYTYDLYSYVIGANKGDIFKTFSIGGGIAEFAMVRSKEKEEDETAKRFKPVSMFKGPLFTDRTGHARVNFMMPDYIGAVRVMVVDADKARYGMAEKTVPVTSDLMVMPTLPRVLGPGDEIKVPVTVFAMKDNLGSTTVSVSVEGPLDIVGDTQHIIDFTNKDDKDIYFTLKAREAIGVSKIKISARSAKASAEYKTELQVRTSSMQEYISTENQLKAGDKIKVNIPGQGIAGSNKATLTIRRTKDLNFGPRLYYLIRYPYGCLEQTTSSVFPQLYLEKFIPKSSLARQDIQDNINRGIKRMSRFLLPSGGFSYWPGSRQVSSWTTNYAGHFLIEAKKMGYHISDDMMNNWLRYQNSQALMTTGDLKTRIYRLYLLALAGKAAMGPMNLIRENSLDALNDTERWLLAAAYKLAGAEKEADGILKKTGLVVKLYREFGGTYGSSNRDKAMILNQLILFGQMNKAEKLVDELAAVIKSHNWLSTQESAFMLMAMGKYLNAVGDKTEGTLKGFIRLADGKKVNFDFDNELFDVAITSDFGKEVTVYLDRSVKLDHAYVVMEWNGVPLRSTQKDEQYNLTLSVRWLNDLGQPVDITNLTQGESIWGHFKVGLQNRSLRVQELALTQILPAGWEIENLRLSQSDLPSWTRGYRIARAEYEDIRDDRISWFFDVYGSSQQDYLVKINAVTAGIFFMPGATFGAMYDNEYRATKAGQEVKVTGR